MTAQHLLWFVVGLVIEIDEIIHAALDWLLDQVDGGRQVRT
jgi:hypothetical protein